MTDDRPGRRALGYGYVGGDVVQGSKFGGDYVNGSKYVGVPGPELPRTPPVEPATVLMLTANPYGTSALRLDQERRAVDQALATAEATGRLVLRTADALQLGDLRTALLRHRPAIAHFSGHGRSGGIAVVGDDGRPVLVPPHALSDLFAVLREGLHCVVLNACLTDEQAAGISASVPCVVGMSSLIEDRAAIAFSAAFYQAIAYGRSIRTAYDLGRNALTSGGYRDADAPVLMARRGAAESAIIAA